MSNIELTPFESHLVNFVEKWRGVPLENLQVRFSELGNLEEALDKLLTAGILRRVQFEVCKQNKFFIVPCETKFLGWR